MSMSELEARGPEELKDNGKWPMVPENDSQGRPISYFGRLEREGRHLHRTEILGDAVQADDRITLLPNVEAGGWRRA